VIAAVPGQYLAFFKVDVDWMIPAAATVLECPDFAGAKPLRRGETTKAGVQHWTIVG